MGIFVSFNTTNSINREMANILNICLTHVFINYSIGKINKGKNMKAIIYVSLLWVVLGILISFVAV